MTPKGEYIQHHPGFIKDGNHPDGLCIPCCFKSWDAPLQKKRRDQCLLGKKIEDKKTTETDDYIKGFDKFPLDQNRRGHIPIEIQKMLHFDSNKCMLGSSNKLKPFVSCFLRKGVEQHEKQSFLGVLADIYSDFIQEEKPTNDVKIKKKDSQPIKKRSTPTIKEFKSILEKAITLDNYITYFNGTLVNVFHEERISLHIHKYRNTNLYKKLNIELIKDKTDDKLIYFKKVCSSYEQFMEYLKSNEEIIDYTYLWDIIAQPNPLLYPKGLNMVIMEISDKDITNNVEIICPTNTYSKNIYNTRKQTILIIKKGDYYEPIYMYKVDDENNLEVRMRFSLNDRYLMSNIKLLMTTIKKSYNKCLPLSSLPRVYKFHRNIPMHEIVKKLKDIKHVRYTIVQQIVNYNNKVIGLILKREKKEKQQKDLKTGVKPKEKEKQKQKEETLTSFTLGYIPCFQSSIDSSIDSMMINDDIWSDLRTTVDFLNTVYTDSKSQIPCKPKMKVLENDTDDSGLVVGILTITNQFIPISVPEQNIFFEELDEIQGNNFMISDIVFSNAKKIDTERIEMVRNVKLENQFYHAFRNTIRNMLHSNAFLDIRNRIDSILKDESLLYIRTLEKIETILQELIKDKILFIEEYDKKILESIDTISSCLQKDKCSSKQFCAVIKTEVKNTMELSDCALTIPRENLISGHNNETIYISRMADEFIRYGKIRDFMFNPSVFLSLEKVEYKVNEDEIILPESILEDDGDGSSYFDDLDRKQVNRYVKHNSYEEAQPQLTEKYPNTYEFDELRKVELKKPKERCIEEVKSSVTGSFSKYFKGCQEEVYKMLPSCGFELLLRIYTDYYNGDTISVDDMKLVLVDKYIRLIKKYGNEKILRYILKDQGKEMLTREVLAGNVSIKQMIFSKEYYVTNMDIILLCEYYELPVVIMANRRLLELKDWLLSNVLGVKVEPVTKENKELLKDDKYKHNRKIWMVRNKPRPFYYFVKQYGIRRNEVLKYSIVVKNNNIRIMKESIGKSLYGKLGDVYIKRPSLEKFIENYRVRSSSKKKEKEKLVLEKGSPKKDIEKTSTKTKAKKKGKMILSDA
jgi:hypothetical protein